MCVCVYFLGFGGQVCISVYVCIYVCVSVWFSDFVISYHHHQGMKKGNVLFNDALNTFFIQFMALDIW